MYLQGLGEQPLLGEAVPDSLCQGFAGQTLTPLKAQGAEARNSHSCLEL